MNAQTKIEAAADQKPTGLALLRAPFPDHHISKLPKETKKQTEERKNRVPGCMVWKCQICGGPHHKDAVHLDYVGHAALTDRLLDCDPEWNWEPVTMPGLPNPGNGMWIKLTVCGVSRIGYGDAGSKSGGDAIKEVIGDALRNAAMRFGAALDLWHKGDLHADEDDAAKPEAKAEKPQQQNRQTPAAGSDPLSDAEWSEMIQLANASGTTPQQIAQQFKVPDPDKLVRSQWPAVKEYLTGRLGDRTRAETNRIASDVDPDEIPY